MSDGDTVFPCCAVGNGGMAVVRLVFASVANRLEFSPPEFPVLPAEAITRISSVWVGEEAPAYRTDIVQFSRNKRLLFSYRTADQRATTILPTPANTPPQFKLNE